jgi:transposase-like protein
MDELSLVAGHKGQPDKVKQANRPPCKRRLKGARGRGTLATEKPPLILQTVMASTQLYTDEYNIDNRLEKWGYKHNTVNHSAGEYARDEDGDGFCEVHSNSLECVWSLLRPWLRPHRAISQDKLPLYLGFFEFVYNVRQRAKRLLASLLETLLKKT